MNSKLKKIIKVVNDIKSDLQDELNSLLIRQSDLVEHYYYVAEYAENQIKIENIKNKLSCYRR